MPRPFDKTRDVTIECPSCRMYRTIDRPPALPAAVVLIELPCPDCDATGEPVETWYSAPGVVVPKTH